MINLTIKLSRSEMADFTQAVTVLYQHSHTLLKADDYLHYYNIQHFWKRLFDKQFKGYTNNSQSVKININEFESLKRYVQAVDEKNIYYDYLSSSFGILIQKVFAMLNRQSIQLSISNQFFLH